jgi:anti-sigma factor RsiW
VTNIWQRILGANRPDLACSELVELVTDYLEGSLTAGARRRFEAHLSVCTGCANYLDQLRETITVVGLIEVDDLGDEMKAELLSAFRGWPRD